MPKALKLPDITIKPFGVHAVLVMWPMEVSETILDTILQFEALLKKEYSNKGGWETVPAYNSLIIINRNLVLDHKKFSERIRESYALITEKKIYDRYLWRLPVSYDLDFGIDLEEIGKKTGCSVAKVIALHTANTYTVYGIGFLPGFMYLGGLPKVLQIPRKPSPRLRVEKGAVGLAGEQTGIYPQGSPGGWNIIGNCPVPMFDVSKTEPCFVSVGDKIRFYQVSRAEYDLHKIEVEVGIYKPQKITLDD